MCKGKHMQAINKTKPTNQPKKTKVERQKKRLYPACEPDG